MSSIDADPAPQQGAEPVRVVCPSWCDPTQCTAPEWLPGEADEIDGYHRSADFSSRELFLPTSGSDGPVYLRQKVTRVGVLQPSVLVIGNTSLFVDLNSPLFFAITDEYKRLEEIFSPGFVQGKRQQVESEDQS